MQDICWDNHWIPVDHEYDCTNLGKVLQINFCSVWVVVLEFVVSIADIIVNC